jgi:hypothetical protein
MALATHISILDHNKIYTNEYMTKVKKNIEAGWLFLDLPQNKHYLDAFHSKNGITVAVINKINDDVQFLNVNNQPGITRIMETDVSH